MAMTEADRLQRQKKLAEFRGLSLEEKKKRIQAVNNVPDTGAPASTMQASQQPIVNKPRIVNGTAMGNDFTIPSTNVVKPKTGMNTTGMSSPVAQGGFTYGTDPAKSRTLDENLKLWETNAAAKNAEIERTIGVIKGMGEGADTSDQYKHLYGTLNYDKPIDTAIPTETPAPDDYSWITEMVNNELAQQQAAIEQELARLQQANELAVNQNNTFLQDSIKRLEENRIKAGAEITNFQNRRGGFYSGGLDFQLGTNNEAFAEAQGDVTTDIGARNADIWNRNSLLAQQAATNLAALQQQAPARIQQLIQEQMEKDRLATLDENKFALETEKFNWTQDKDTAQLNLDTRIQDTKELELMSKLTGFLPNGQPTSEYQQQILKNAWDVINKIGVVPPELASIVGIKAGTKTLDAIKVAISKQNATTSRMNVDLSQSKFTNEQDVNTLQSQVMDGIAQFDNAQDASAWLNANASNITASLGADTFAELKKMLPLFFGEDNSQDQATASAKLRQEALSLAQKDFRWNKTGKDEKDTLQNKEDLIQEYIKLLGG